ncbi:MAG: hypothetical protein IJ165_00655 [Proteobacteria bacterium]|nr:hypothetical protein [Pseudomonadota bacterium]
MKTIYIHGFNSYKNSSTPRSIHKAAEVKVHEAYYHSDQYFPEILASLKAQITKITADGDTAILIGTSLGGFLADQLCDEPNVCAVIMINPVVDACAELHKDIYQGEMTNPINHKTYLVTPELADSYLAKRDMRDVRVTRYLVLSDHDELLDSSLAKAYWEPVSTFIQIEGPHRLTDFDTISQIIHEIMGE